MKRTLTSLLAVIAAATTISAKVTLPEIIGDNMILQQQTKVRIWGKAPAGNTVYIITSWSREKTKVTADGDGNGRITENAKKIWKNFTSCEFFDKFRQKVRRGLEYDTVVRKLSLQPTK